VDQPAELPPLPDESALFVPPAERGNRKEKSLGLLAERMLQNYPFMLEPGNPTQVHHICSTSLSHLLSVFRVGGTPVFFFLKAQPGGFFWVLLFFF
jgi:hypothetical protein